MEFGHVLIKDVCANNNFFLKTIELKIWKFGKIWGWNYKKKSKLELRDLRNCILVRITIPLPIKIDQICKNDPSIAFISAMKLIAGFSIEKICYFKDNLRCQFDFMKIILFKAIILQFFTEKAMF